MSQLGQRRILLEGLGISHIYTAWKKSRGAAVSQGQLKSGTGPSWDSCPLPRPLCAFPSFPLTADRISPVLGYAASGLCQPIWRCSGWRWPHTCIVWWAEGPFVKRKRHSFFWMQSSSRAQASVGRSKGDRSPSSVLHLGAFARRTHRTARISQLLSVCKGAHASLTFPVKCPHLHLPNAQPLVSSAFSFSS